MVILANIQQRITNLALTLPDNADHTKKNDTTTAPSRRDHPYVGEADNEGALNRIGNSLALVGHPSGEEIIWFATVGGATLPLAMVGIIMYAKRTQSPDKEKHPARRIMMKFGIGKSKPTR
jgi:hypothetical protein